MVTVATILFLGLFSKTLRPVSSSHNNRTYPKYWDTLTPYFVLKFEKVYSSKCGCVWNIAEWVANIVDSDQLQHSAASDLGLHYRDL